MIIALEQLTTSTLPHLFVEETKLFIKLLDGGVTDELVEKKLKLIHISNLLAERELKEKTKIKWGKNSTKSEKDSH